MRQRTHAANRHSQSSHEDPHTRAGKSTGTPMKPPAGSINLDPPIWPTGPDLRHNAAHTK